MDLKDCQELMRKIYFERDRVRGAERTLLWMLSEAGEVADAYVKRSDRVRSELADLLAWLLSCCNVLGVDLEREFVSRYGAGCPRCGKTPCVCEFC
jgi:NTP pyrophosphatase (non-canonical NTP hydrolase)